MIKDSLSWAGSVANHFRSGAFRSPSNDFSLPVLFDCGLWWIRATSGIFYPWCSAASCLKNQRWQRRGDCCVCCSYCLCVCVCTGICVFAVSLMQITFCWENRVMRDGWERERESFTVSLLLHFPPFVLGTVSVLVLMGLSHQMPAELCD